MKSGSRSNYWLRTGLPVIITSLCALIVSADYFYAEQNLSFAAKALTDWTVALIGFSFLLGAITFLRYQVSLLSKKKAGQWFLVPITLVVFVSFVIVGFGYGVSSPLFNILYSNLFAPGDATQFAIIFFWMVSATYRTFRAKTLDGTLLLIAALVTMLMNAPIGEVLVPGSTDLGNWLLNFPNTAGQRAIVVGAALGSIGLILRIILGRERSHFGISG